VATIKANTSVMIQTFVVMLIFLDVTILENKHQTWFFLYIWWCLSSAIYGIRILTVVCDTTGALVSK